MYRPITMLVMLFAVTMAWRAEAVSPAEQGITSPVEAHALPDGTNESSEVLKLRPFSARYRVSTGMLSGDLTLELDHKSGEDWVLTSVATTRGVARLFRRGELIERSVIRFTANGIKPLEYTREDGISGPERDAALVFSYADNRVYGFDREHTVDLPINGEVIDRLSVQVQLMRDLTAGLRPDEYFVIDRGEIREMDIRYGDIETVQVADQQLDALILDHQSRNSSRSTRLWAAVEQDYLPVRIEQIRRGRTEWLGTLEQVRWGEMPESPNAVTRPPAQ